MPTILNPRPVEAEAVDNQTLLVKFNNGEVKKVDVSIFLKYPMYKKLNDYSFFKQVKADRTTACLSWSCSLCGQSCPYFPLGNLACIRYPE